MDPIDIDFAERLLPKLREAAMEALADEALDQILDQGKLHMEMFPFDATVSNNLAWAAAMNKRRLDEALELSERAVYIEPDSAVYRDTLAEVLFLIGRVSEALSIEESCCAGRSRSMALTSADRRSIAICYLPNELRFANKLRWALVSTQNRMMWFANRCKSES